jgi:hypothetical protein
MQGLLSMQGSLQGLELCGDACDDAAAAVVAQLTRLTSLQFSSSAVTPVGLEKLTVLKALQHLKLENFVTNNQLAAMLRPKQILELATTSQVRSAALTVCSAAS